MKSTKTLLTLLFFSFALLSCENEELDQENQQEYFEIIDNETDLNYYTSNVSAVMVEEQGYLLIEGWFDIAGQQRCTEILFYTGDVNSLIGNHILNEDDFWGHIGCGEFGEYFTTWETELNISEFGNVGEYITLSFNGAYRVIDNPSETHEMSGNVKVLRD